MNFFRSLFGDRRSKEEPFDPKPTQTIQGLDPIVVYAVEQLTPSLEEQKYSFQYLLKNTEANDTIAQLTLLRLGIRELENLIEKTPTLTVRYAIYSERFSNMKAAKQWVKSITAPS